MSAVKICNLIPINQHVFMQQPKPTFETLEAITVANLKFRPIIDQIGTFTYNMAKVISDY